MWSSCPSGCSSQSRPIYSSLSIELERSLDRLLIFNGKTADYVDPDRKIRLSEILRLQYQLGSTWNRVDLDQIVPSVFLKSFTSIFIYSLIDNHPQLQIIIWQKHFISAPCVWVYSCLAARYKLQAHWIFIWTYTVGHKVLSVTYSLHKIRATHFSL